MENQLKWNHQEIFSQTSPFSERGLPFVGRSFELKQLVSNLALSLENKGQVMLVSGEPGVGKTRLSAQVISQAEAMGFRCLSAKSSSNNGENSPYSIWVDFLRQFSNEASAQLFFKVCGAHVDQVVRLVPELFESTGMNSNSGSYFKETEVNPQRRDQQYDFKNREELQMKELEFFSALAQVFLKLSETAPLLLVIDDLQWCDGSSVRLLDFFVTNYLTGAKISILCLCRDLDLIENQGVTDFVEKRKGQFLFIQLGRLKEENFKELMAQIFSSGDNQDQSMLELGKVLFSRTGGNPLFVGELLKSLLEKQIIFQNGKGTWSCLDLRGTAAALPETITSVIKGRLEVIESPFLGVLRLASVFGEKFDLASLEQVANQTPSLRGVREAIKRGIRTGLVLEPPNEKAGNYQFSDESVREVLYGELTGSEKRIYHLAIAELSEKKYLEDSAALAKEHLGELAEHYFNGANFDKSLEYSIKAGYRASELYAHGQACTYFTRALELLDKATSSVKNRLLLEAELVENLGVESQFVPDYARVFQCWEKAAALYEQCGQNNKAARLLGNLSLIYHLVLYDIKKSKITIQKAISLLEQDCDKPSKELAQLVSYDVLPDIWSAETAKLREKIANSVSLAKQTGAYDVLAMATCYAVAADPALEVEKSLTVCKQGLELAQSHGLIWEASYCYFHIAISHTYTYGPSRKSMDLFLEGMDFTASKGYFLVNLFHKFSLVCDVYLPLGEWKKAREVTEVLERTLKSYPENSLVRLGAEVTLGNLMLYEGEDLARAGEYLRHVEKVTKGFGFLQLDVALYIALAILSIEKEKNSEAESHLREGYKLTKKRGITVLNAMPHVRLLELYVRFYSSSVVDSPEESRAKSLDEKLSELADAMKQIPAEWPRAYYKRAEGLVFARNKRFEDAINSIEESIQIFEKLEWPYELASTQYELGVLHLKRGNALASSKALGVSFEIFSRLGAKGYLAKIEKVRQKIEEHGVPLFDERPQFENKESELIFENLLTEFMEDFLFEKIDIEKCGWRSLSELGQGLKISKHALYGRSTGTMGPVLKELLSTGLVESRTFAGERGRGGEVTRIRISYSKTSLKWYTAPEKRPSSS